MLALEQALEIITQQETWSVNDDLCDCTYQFQCYYTNPYVGVTYEVRLCCLYAEFEKQYPHLFRRQVFEPAVWDGEADMPQSIWHRQMANHLGVSVEEARAMAGNAPKGAQKAEKVPFYLAVNGMEYLVHFG